MTDTQTLKILGGNIRRLREAREWSLSELARQIDDYPASVKRIEDGMSMPGLGLSTRIAEALDVTIDELLTPQASREKILAKAT